MFSVRIILLLLSVIFYFETSYGDGYPSGSPSNPLEIIANPPTTTTPSTEHDHHHDHHHHHGEDGKYNPNDDGTGWDIRKSVPGEPGVDYPIYDAVPTTSFTCIAKKPGYYGDKETRCQVFRVCMEGARNAFSSFLCPNGSIFNQEVFACDWWNKVNCDMSDEFYDLNDRIDAPTSVPVFMDKVKNMLDYPIMNPIISDNSIDNQQSGSKLVENSEKGYLPPTTRKYYSPTIPTTTEKYTTPVFSNIGGSFSTSHYQQPSIDLQTPSSFAPYPSSSTSHPNLNNQYLSPSISGYDTSATFSQNKPGKEYIQPHLVSPAFTSLTSSEKPKIETQQFVNVATQENYVSQEQSKPSSFQTTSGLSDDYQYSKPTSSFPERSSVLSQHTKNDYSQNRPVQTSKTTSEIIKQKPLDFDFDVRINTDEKQSNVNAQYENSVSTVKPVQNIPTVVQNYNQQFESSGVYREHQPDISQNVQSSFAEQLQTIHTSTEKPGININELRFGINQKQQEPISTLNIIAPSEVPKLDYQNQYQFVHSQISHQEIPVTHQPDYQSGSYDSSKQSFINSQQINASPFPIQHSSDSNSITKGPSVTTESPEVIKLPLSSGLTITKPDSVKPIFSSVTEHDTIQTTQRPFSSSIGPFSSTSSSIKPESAVSSQVPSIVAQISANKIDEPRKFGINSLSSAITITNQQNNLDSKPEAKIDVNSLDVRTLNSGEEFENKNVQISQNNEGLKISTEQRSGFENTGPIIQSITGSFPTTATYPSEEGKSISGGHFGQFGDSNLSPESQNTGTQFADKSGFINTNTFTNLNGNVENVQGSVTISGERIDQSGVSHLPTDSIYQNGGFQVSQRNDIYNTAAINSLQENPASDGSVGQLGISNVSPSSVYQNDNLQYSQKSAQGFTTNGRDNIQIAGNVENLGQFGLPTVAPIHSYQNGVSQFESSGGISRIETNVQENVGSNRNFGNIGISNVSPTAVYQNQDVQFAQRTDISNTGNSGSNFGQGGFSQVPSISTVQNEAPQVSFINYSGNEQSNKALNANTNVNNNLNINQGDLSNSYPQPATSSGGFSQVTQQYSFQSTPAPVQSTGTQNYPGQNIGITIPRYSTSDTGTNNAAKTNIEYSVNIVPALSYSFDADSEKEAYVNDFIEGRFESKYSQSPTSFASSFLNRNANIQSNNNYQPSLITSSIGSFNNNNGFQSNGKFVGHSSYLAPQGSIEKLPQDTGSISQSYGTIGNIEEGYIRSAPETKFESR